MVRRINKIWGKIIETGKGKSTSLIGGTKEQNSGDRVWNMLIALGNVALASSYSQIAIDIQVRNKLI